MHLVLLLLLLLVLVLVLWLLLCGEPCRGTTTPSPLLVIPICVKC